jgi:hypothetical protein
MAATEPTTVASLSISETADVFTLAPERRRDEHYPYFYMNVEARWGVSPIWTSSAGVDGNERGMVADLGTG